jgi:tetratricopeptide (TPR) repeat protein
MTPASEFQILRPIKVATASLQSRVGLGTGYLVEPLRIATCAHVVRGLAPNSKVHARFTDWDPAGVQATLLALDEKSDSALLSLDVAPPGAEPLPLTSEEPAVAECLAYGFPAFADGLGVPLSGIVMDRDARIPGNLRGLAIYSSILGSNPPQSLGGFSGSPVMINGRVVGHLSSVLGADDRMKQSHLGYTFAVPASGVLALLGRPVPVQEHRGEATSEGQIAQRSRAFYRLQYSGSGEEVRTILDEARKGGDLTGELCVYAAQVLIGLLLPDQALDVLGNLDSQRARELKALALSLRGDHAAGEALARNLGGSAEVLGIQGGILKRRWLATRNAAFLRSAFERYLEAYTTFRDHYTGINAAACALYLKQVDVSQKIAQEIVGALAQKAARDKWEEASLAEGYLLTGRADEARAHYRKACDAEPTRTREIAVMSTQARRDLKHLGRSANEVAGAFPPAQRAAAFTGHRAGPRLPEERMAELRQRIDEVLDEHEVRFGFCSAASGSDLLFIDALLERGAEVRVFLPVPRDRFIEQSVGPDPRWIDQFNRTLARLGPGRIIELPEAVLSDGDPSAFVTCNEVLQDSARRHAALLGEPPMLIAVVAADSEQQNAALGGSAHAIRMWLGRGGREVVRIDPLT